MFMNLMSILKLLMIILTVRHPIFQVSASGKLDQGEIDI